MRRGCITACLIALAVPAWASAGMPAPLPSGGASGDDNVVSRLSDFGLLRFQTMSFFVAVFLLSSLVFKWLWNWLRRDFPRLPQLSYLQALGVVFLWSLLFVIVLTMISGARELMTPGAWKKQGFTYKLTDDAKPTAPIVSPEAERRQHLEKLRTALFQYAAFHKGHFPRSEEMSAIAEELWHVPRVPSLRYLYVPGLAAGHAPDPLVYEPELGSGPCLVLCINGDVLQKSTAELATMVKAGKP